jgi:hypothetical protein
VPISPLGGLLPLLLLGGLFGGPPRRRRYRREDSDSEDMDHQQLRLGMEPIESAIELDNEHKIEKRQLPVPAAAVAGGPLPVPAPMPVPVPVPVSNPIVDLLFLSLLLGGGNGRRPRFRREILPIIKQAESLTEPEINALKLEVSERLAREIATIHTPEIEALKSLPEVKKLIAEPAREIEALERSPEAAKLVSEKAKEALKRSSEAAKLLSEKAKEALKRSPEAAKLVSEKAQETVPVV